MSLKMINIQKYLFFAMMMVFSTFSFAQKNEYSDFNEPLPDDFWLGGEIL